jgi:hypothetical protein
MNDAVCKNREAAILIIDTITKAIPVGTQREALVAVRTWIVENTQPYDTPATPEERKAKIQEIKNDLRDCMTDYERKEEAAFYLEGL